MQNTYNPMNMNNMMNNQMAGMIGSLFPHQNPNQFMNVPNTGNRISVNQNTLMVGDIRKDVTQDYLQSHFQTFQVPFKQLHMKQTQGNYNIAFVKCLNDQDCERIRVKANHTRLNNKPIRVFFMKSKEELEKQQNTKSNLIVKNLDRNMDGLQMDQLFNQFGRIVSSKLSTDYDGNSLGYGYIQFENEDQAKKCYDHFKDSKTIQVDQFMMGKIKEYQTNNLYVKGFPKNMDEETLRKKLIPIFEKFGKIGSFKFVSKEMSGSSMIFAFICYEDNSSAQQALNEMNEQDVFNTGDLLNVNWFQKKGDREKLLKREFNAAKTNSNLFMKGLKETVTSDSLYQVFQKFGQINKYDIKKSSDQKITSLMAFCSYENDVQARSAKESANDPEVQDLFVNGRVMIHFWLPKSIFQKRKDQFKSQKGSNNQDQMSMVMNMLQSMFGNYFPGRMMQPMMGQPNMMKKMPMFNQQIINKPMNHMNMNRFGQSMPQMQNPQMMNPQMMGQPMMGQPMMGQPMMGQPMMNQSMMGQPMMGQSAMQHSNMPMMNNMPRQQQQFMGQPPVQQKPPNKPPKSTQNKAFSSPQEINNNIEQFKALPADAQRKILGEQLYPRVNELIMANSNGSKAASAQVPKITGMLIDFEVFEVEEIIGFFNDRQTLHERIKEAQELLEENQQ